MIIIQTRQNSKGGWFCNATINGYDYSFEGITALGAQAPMDRKITELKLPLHSFYWEPCEYYVSEPELPEPPIKMQPYRVDKGMV